MSSRPSHSATAQNWGVVRGRLVWVAVGAAALLAGGAALLVPLMRSATSGDPAPETSRRLFACAEVQPSDGYCERMAGDLAERDQPTNIERADAEGFVERVRAVFEGRLGARCEGRAEVCVFAVPPTVEALRAALDAGGLPAPVVRAARYTDPAPLGATVYAVNAGGACLVGWVEATAGSTIQVVGRRLDGRCLPD